MMEPLRYVSIDLETTGLDPNQNDIIEFGAVVETVGSSVPVEDLPKFHAYIERETYHGQAFALSMHPIIFRRIATREPGFNYLIPSRVGVEFAAFLAGEGFGLDKDNKFKIIGAGKNFASFDHRFLINLERFTDHIKIGHRSIDPVTLYFDPITMSELPGLTLCMKLAGLDGNVKHTAVEDAQDVVRLFRFKWKP